MQLKIVLLPILGSMVVLSCTQTAPTSPTLPQPSSTTAPTPTIVTSFYVDPKTPTITPTSIPEHLPLFDVYDQPGNVATAHFGDLIAPYVDPQTWWGSENPVYVKEGPSYIAVLDLLLVDHPQGDIVYNFLSGESLSPDQRPPRNREPWEIFIPAGLTLVGVETQIYDEDKNPFGCNPGQSVKFRAGDYPNVWLSMDFKPELPEGQLCSALTWSLGFYPAVGIEKNDVLIFIWETVIYP